MYEKIINCDNFRDFYNMFIKTCIYLFSFGILPLCTPITNNQDLEIQSADKTNLKKVC